MKFKKFMALALAGVMTFAMAGTVFAEDPNLNVPGETEAAGDGKLSSVTINKTVNVAHGITLPADAITFTAAQIDNADGVTAPAEIADIVTTISGITADNPSGSATIDFSSITKPGEYNFTLTETSPTDKGNDTYGWTIDTASYNVQVLVKSDGAKEYYLTKAGETGKQDAAAFTNTYTKQASPLTISKTVVGDYADLTQGFEFTVTFTETATAPVPQDGFSYKIGDGDAQTVASGGKITLKNGESAVFADIPAGVTVEVTETAVENYETPTIAIKENGTSKTAEGLSSGAVVLGENENSIAFTNTYKKITITGLSVSIAPFIAMFAAVGAAIALYIAAKRRVR